MKNQAVEQLIERIISIVREVGLTESIMVEARYARFSHSQEVEFRGYIVSIFHKDGRIHQYTKLTADEAIAQAQSFAAKYAAGDFGIVNTYQEQNTYQEVQ